MPSNWIASSRRSSRRPAPTRSAMGKSLSPISNMSSVSAPVKPAKMRFDTGENSMFMSFNLKKLLGAFGVVLLLMSPFFAFGDQTSAPAAPAASAPAAAPAAAPVPNKGDVSWMLVSTALVLMMSVPALALFYGGMVRSKNALSVLMQGFVVFMPGNTPWRG